VAHDVGAAALVDASQTLGCVPVRAEEWGVDMLAFTGHKYLLGPQGTGGLYVRPGLELSPLLLGGTGVKSDLETMPDEMPTHLRPGPGTSRPFTDCSPRWSGRRKTRRTAPPSLWRRS
jgi:selenocysteine lyase/cysteine desulfurase